MFLSEYSDWETLDALAVLVCSLTNPHEMTLWVRQYLPSSPSGNSNLALPVVDCDSEGILK